ncbi:MAG: methyltransferase domain-containing protein [Planctomycetes bacterium]|nr:methyltransferase domain-containing protein [Planctomycetota bacterium]
MKHPCRARRGVSTVVVLLLAAWWPAVGAGPASSAPAATAPAATAAAGEPRYTFRRHHDPNGTGKFYMGREIALVMGHPAVGWLERPEREREEEPAKLIAALELRPGDVVADIGAGSGYITTRLARAVGADGRVKAVDIQPEMLEALRNKLAAEDIGNVDLVLGEEADPKLPDGSVDLVLMVDVYHELAWPFEMMQAVVRALKPAGRVVLVEYRKEDPAVPIKLVHKMTAAQAIAEMNAVGLRHRETIATLPRQHILIFERPIPTSRPATPAE